MVLVRKWIFNKPYDGDATKDNFKLIEEELEPTLEDGGILCFKKTRLFKYNENFTTKGRKIFK